MKLASEIVKDYFITNRVALALGTYAGSADWSVYIGSEPKEPLNCITIYDTAGTVPQRTYKKTENPLEKEGFQIRVRGASKTTAYNKLRVLSKSLSEAARFTVAGDTVVKGFVQKSAFLDLGLVLDSKKTYYLWTVNFELINQKV